MGKRKRKSKKHHRLADQRYAQLRRLIERAKEDAENWGTTKPLLLSGIPEKTVFDFDIYDQAFRKFVQQRAQKKSADEAVQEIATENRKAEEAERVEAKTSGEEYQLKRIADALERLADCLEKTNN